MKYVKFADECLYFVDVDTEENARFKSKGTYGLYPPIACALQVFSSMGGLALLAQHLPTVYPETIRASTSDKPTQDQSESDWVKVVEGIYAILACDCGSRNESCVSGSDEIYEDVEETPGTSAPSKSTNPIPNVPPHSLTAFGLFLRLPGYADYLLRDMKKALCLLRLVLGVTDDGEGTFRGLFRVNVV